MAERGGWGFGEIDRATHVKVASDFGVAAWALCDCPGPAATAELLAVLRKFLGAVVDHMPVKTDLGGVVVRLLRAIFVVWVHESPLPNTQILILNPFNSGLMFQNLECRGAT